MNVIEPITITDAMLTSSSVTEDDYPEWSAAGAALMLYNATALDWTGIAVDSATSEVYACSTTELVWSGIAVDQHTKTIYSCVKGGDIYIRTQGESYFTALGQTSRDWSGIAINPATGDVYACVTGGDIYKRTAGAGDFVALGQTIRNWSGLSIDPSASDCYASVAGGDLYKQTGGAGSFVGLSQTARAWNGISFDSNAANTYDCYACVTGGDIYRRTRGETAFVAMGLASKSWSGVAVDSSTGDLYACVARLGLYVYGATVYAAGDRVISLTDHGIYESLVSSNLRRDPVTDAVSSIPSWLKIGTTNRWKMLDPMTTTQTADTDSIVVALTPGVGVTGLGLLEVEATQVEVVITVSGAPIDSRTVEITDAVTDVVFQDLAADSAAVITITISKTETARCGMVVIGNPTDVGALVRDFAAGIITYSDNVPDKYGNRSPVERAFAKRGTYEISIPNASVNTVQRFLARFVATPALFIGAAQCASTIIFGTFIDLDIVVPGENRSRCSVEVDGWI